MVLASFLVSNGFLKGLCNGVWSVFSSPSSTCGVEEKEEVPYTVRNLLVTPLPALTPTPLVVSSVCPLDLPMMIVGGIVVKNPAMGKEGSVILSPHLGPSGRPASESYVWSFLASTPGSL